MRDFIDEKGFFKIKIPNTWSYTLMNLKVHTFSDNEAIGVFQISFQKTNDAIIKNYKKLIQNLVKVKFGKHTLYYLPISDSEKLCTKLWEGQLDNYLMTTSFTFSKAFSNSKRLQKELKKINKVIANVEVIQANERKNTLVLYRLGQFLKGIAATNELLINAIHNKSFIEAVCILANQIDALLRTGLILKQQLIQHNSEIDLKFLYQGDSDKIISEKEVYKKSKKWEIITNEIFNSLYSLYNERNKVVHKYIISDITTYQIENIAKKYFRLRQKVRESIVELEDEQIKTGIGMTKAGKAKDNMGNIMESWIKEKHGGIVLR